MDDEGSALPWPLEVLAVLSLMAVGLFLGMAALGAADAIRWRIEHGGQAGNAALLAVSGVPTYLMAKRMSPSRARRWAAKAGLAAVAVGALAFLSIDPTALDSGRAPPSRAE